MKIAGLLQGMEFARSRTLAFLDELEKLPDAQKVLGWRPGPERAHIAWQLMHLGATDDRHLNIHIKQDEAKETQYVERFAGGSTPDDNIPTVDEIRHYITERRQAIMEHFQSLDDSNLDQKPHDAAKWDYGTWIQILSWHEGHHQGQAHLTLNMYKAAH